MDKTKFTLGKNSFPVFFATNCTPRMTFKIETDNNYKNATSLRTEDIPRKTSSRKHG
jgi:hypothetical protein